MKATFVEVLLSVCRMKDRLVFSKYPEEEEQEKCHELARKHP